MSDEFFASNRQNMQAVAMALDALSDMAPEFRGREEHSETWFYDMACETVAGNYRLLYLIDGLSGAATVWQSRVGTRLLVQETIAVIEQMGGILTRTFENQVIAITNNPRLLEPLQESAKEFATFRRINDKEIRGFQKSLNLIETSKKRERIVFDQDLDTGAVMKLALATVIWVSGFGKGVTLVISALRGKGEG
ncbi:MAG: hypothetical protein H0W83_04005 [Planctomycetes bacterium]|nr:hypothetical protein [Planctomycetota bacterium]